MRYTTNTMFVVTNDGVLVADGQGSIAAANLVIDEMKKITTQPIKYFVICTEHTDHTGHHGVPRRRDLHLVPVYAEHVPDAGDRSSARGNAPKVIVPSVTVDDKKVHHARRN